MWKEHFFRMKKVSNVKIVWNSLRSADHFSLHFVFFAYAGCLVGAGCRVFVQRLGYMCNKKGYNLLVLLGSQFLKRQNFWNFGKNYHFCLYFLNTAWTAKHSANLTFWYSILTLKLRNSKQWKTLQWNAFTILQIWFKICCFSVKSE